MLSLAKNSKEPHLKAGEKLFCVSVLNLLEYPQHSATYIKNKKQKTTPQTPNTSLLPRFIAEISKNFKRTEGIFLTAVPQPSDRFPQMSQKDGYLPGFQARIVLHLFALALETFQAIFINLFPTSQWSIKLNVTLCKRY